MLELISSKLIALYVGLGIIVSSVFGIPTKPAEQPIQLAGTFTPVQAQKFTLSGSGVSGSATSITLQTMHTPDGRDISMSMLGDTGYGTLEPGTTREEQISFTGITQNADDTATLTNVSRGLDFVSPYTASSSLQKAHAGGTIFILTNTAKFYGQEFALTNSTATVTGKWTFASSTDTWPRVAATSSFNNVSGTLFATKDYVDNVASSGASNADLITKGLVEIATKQELASSTATGATGAILVPQNSFFAPTSSATTTVVVTQTNGLISPTFISTSSDYVWSGNNSYTGTSTFSGGDSKFNASTSFSATTTFTGTVVAPFSYILDASSTSVSANNTDATTTLVSVTVPSSTLIGKNIIRTTVYFDGGNQNTANELLDVKLNFGGSLVASGTIAAQFGTTGKMVFNLHAVTSSSQFGSIWWESISQGSASTTVAATSTFLAMGYFRPSGQVAASVSATSSQTMTATIKWQASNANNTITMRQYSVEVLKNQ